MLQDEGPLSIFLQFGGYQIQGKLKAYLWHVQRMVPVV